MTSGASSEHPIVRANRQSRERRAARAQVATPSGAGLWARYQPHVDGRPRPQRRAVLTQLPTSSVNPADSEARQRERARAVVGDSDGELYILMMRINGVAMAHSKVVEFAAAMNRLSAPYLNEWAAWLRAWSDFFDHALPINLTGWWPANDQDVATARQFNTSLNMLIQRYADETGDLGTMNPVPKPEAKTDDSWDFGITEAVVVVALAAMLLR